MKSRDENVTECVNLLKANKNLILIGALGIGKTNLAKDIAEQLILNFTSHSITSSEITTAIKRGMTIDSCTKRTQYDIKDITNTHVHLSGKTIKSWPISFDLIIDAYNNKLWEVGKQKNGFDPYSAALAKYIWENGKNYNKNDSAVNYIEIIQFHPLYGYLDFMEGLHLVKNDETSYTKMELKSGIFKEFCKKALLQNNCKFVFIINQINQGDISNIFGELSYNISKEYRGEKGKIHTLYQSLIKNKNDPFYNGFYVPENIYIIGIINEIDRNAKRLDFSLLRNFAWKSIKANDSIEMLDCLDTILKKKVVNVMKRLNDAIWNENDDIGIEGLSPAYHIGGSYFRKIELYLPTKKLYTQNEISEAFKSLWNNHLSILLREYLIGLPNSVRDLKCLENIYYGTINKL